MSAPFYTAARLTDLLDTPRTVVDLMTALAAAVLGDLPFPVDQAAADALDALTDLQAEILGVL